MSLVLVRNLSKRFFIAKRQPGFLGALWGLFSRKKKLIQAVDDISFSIEEGEMVGFIGPNGAGKSTTLKIICGILTPDRGDVRVFGLEPCKERQRVVAHLGVVFGQRTQLWWDLPVIESFALIKDIYKVTASRYHKNLDELACILSLEPLFDTPVRQLSLGQRMRCELAAALLYNPRLLVLDEPTIGLDAVTKLAVRGFIAQMNKERSLTAILTTHDLDDIKALCPRVLGINKGSIIHDGNAAFSEELLQKLYCP